MNRVYLDHASTSPLRDSARDAMRAALDESDPGTRGDPSRSHHEGLFTRAIIEQARDEVAQLFHARSSEVMFCSGATEAIATVARGVTRRGTHVVLTATEHSAVRLACESAHSTIVGVGPSGIVDADEVIAAITPDTSVVHVQWGNHETGSLQPVTEIAAACRERGVLFHVDAAQAAGHVPIDFAASNIDLLSISGHKLGGPPGTGALLVRRGVRLTPLLVGGDQERSRRGGLENWLGIVGLGAAARELTSSLTAEIENQRNLSRKLVDWIDNNDGMSLIGDRTERLPHIVCAQLDGLEPQPVLIGLDRRGIAVHSGNSCSSEAFEPSPVLAAMGVDAHHSLRVSLGWNSEPSDIDHLLLELPNVIAQLRSLRRE